MSDDCCDRCKGGHTAAAPLRAAPCLNNNCGKVFHRCHGCGGSEGAKRSLRAHHAAGVCSAMVVTREVVAHKRPLVAMSATRQVTIRTTGDRLLVVFVDGDQVGFGVFGGEPEDNSLARDYAWVPSVMRRLAESLGATVSVVKEDEDDEDECEDEEP